MATEIQFELNSESLSIRDVYEKFGHRLPVIIQVRQGHYGDIDIDTYSTGHTMRIHSYSKQRRVVANDTHGRHLSIPVDYPVTAKIKKKDGREESLRKIVEKNILPIRIELCKPPDGYSLHIGKAIQGIGVFGVLNLTNIYDETYLLANSINEGHLDEAVLSVPIYLQTVKVSVVSGIKGQPRSAFTAFQRKMNKVANGIMYQLTGGNSDIAVYSPDIISSSAENVYDYIEPNHFIKYRATNQKRKDSATMSCVNELRDRIEQKQTQSTYAQLHAVGDGQEYSNLTPQQDDVAPPPVPARTYRSSALYPFEPNNKGGLINDRGRDAVKSSQTTSLQRSDHVKGLGIQELADNLETLKLSKYARCFKDAQVDGDLLLELNEESLKSDFNMKHYEAAKLMKFARTGHVPQ
ncbi:hypothetical protein SNE40_006090 [Patella caerulea]|uniref:SAM domain-containing protein n=1 Tax=Patella caerulea TaxID=87958 RepID=A0AAN8K0S1_PATCE